MGQFGRFGCQNLDLASLRLKLARNACYPGELQWNSGCLLALSWFPWSIFEALMDSHEDVIPFFAKLCRLLSVCVGQCRPECKQCCLKHCRPGFMSIEPIALVWLTRFQFQLDIFVSLGNESQVSSTKATPRSHGSFGSL